MPNLKIGRVGILLPDTLVLNLNGIHRNAPAAQFLLDAISKTQREFSNRRNEPYIRIIIKVYFLIFASLKLMSRSGMDMANGPDFQPVGSDGRWSLAPRHCERRKRATIPGSIVDAQCSTAAAG